MSDYNVKKTASSKLRDGLDHPVIDTDGHVIEAAFVLPDFLKQVGGTDLVEGYQKLSALRRGPGGPKSVPWGTLSGEYTIDRATVMLPHLYARRLEEAGVDFSTVYSTSALARKSCRMTRSVRAPAAPST